MRSWSSGYDGRLPSDGPGFNSRRAHFLNFHIVESLSGAMDSASDFGSGGWGFESPLGLIFLSNFWQLVRNWYGFHDLKAFKLTLIQKCHAES